MRKINRTLYGALAGCLFIPGGVSAQSGYDPDWAMKLLPARMKPAGGERSVSPYNPNVNQPEHSGLLQTGFFGDGTFRPTPVPGLKMMFQGDKPTTNGLPATPAATPNYLQPTPASSQPMQMPASPSTVLPAPAPTYTVPLTTQPGLPVVPPDASTYPQSGSSVQPGMTMPQSSMPMMQNGMTVQSGVPVQSYVVGPDGMPI